MHVFTFLEDIIFPTQCIFCGKDGRMVCSACVHTIPLTHPVCAFCSAWNSNGNTCISCRRTFRLASTASVFPYADPRVRDIIKHLKFTHQFAVLESIRREIAERFIPYAESMRPEILIPVPSGTYSFNKRGYHPAKLIALVCSSVSGIPVRSILKARTQPAQHFKKRTDRMKHLESNFDMHRLAKTFKRAMVIDDILTTGATAEAATRTLLAIGFEHVSAFTLARQERLAN